MAKTYSGKDIEISFDMARCIHARACFLKLPQVFDPAKRPWVSPDAAHAEDIAAMVRTCPSGALGFKRLDGGVDETPPVINRVQVLENGPLALAGDLNIDGKPDARATLCRCGQSANMPYCDYSHTKAEFTASGEPNPDIQDRPAEDSKATLTVTPVENGPLIMSGPAEVITGTGKRINRAEKLFLCRCGQSKNKPFCDGTHKQTGFTVPGPST
ncbi:CDGSH iron-sulfur domain-containing protein [Aestuariibius sp. HNIBRBA575]|uniref:CDGSH iron-sulfur domain-containing protein n=1 Tax=Aestuariibius sp. HNIBRBA575 TaxID=3233343 RepID=UPI0034A438AD